MYQIFLPLPNPPLVQRKLDFPVKGGKNQETLLLKHPLSKPGLLMIIEPMQLSQKMIILYL